MTHPKSDNHLEQIAIIGMAGRFPGAPNLDTFWQNLRDGVEGISRFSEQEMAADGINPATFKNPNHVPAGPVLQAVDQFDADFFDISPRQAELTDPQQRLFLECVWEALESAGCDPAAFDGAVGVYGGSTLNTYLLHNVYPALGYTNTVANLQTLIGNDKDYLATHVSYKLNLTGPSLTVQTACSTSLVAVHLACQSLLNGECDMALAGGVTVRVPQKAGYFYQDGGILSPDGHCRPFDADAEGTIFGSGVGVVVLKRLEDALADGDRIEAVIRGSAINNDGSLKVGYTAPGEDGQAAVIDEALTIAGVNPETIGYVEAHGTGTPLGDPIEVAALTRVFRTSTDAAGYCALGAVKSNVGHMEAAAGIAGLIKTVLVLKHGQIPPTLHYKRPNPQIDFTKTPFYVNTQLVKWPENGTPRRAGVSSFGIGGTNAHIIMEEAPALTAAIPAQDNAYLLPLSARTPAALQDLIRDYQGFLADNFCGTLADIGYTAALRRRHHECRLAVAGRTRQELIEQLQDALQTGLPDANGQMVFVFPGQGSQWVGMGQQLWQHEPVFRQAIAACEAAIRPFTNWSLQTILLADKTEMRLQDIDVIQPVLFAIQVGLAALWRAWGIVPDAVVGHSMGEVAAAHVAGVLSLEDAARIICLRSKLLRQVSGQGGMAVVGLMLAEADKALTGYEEQLSVAVSNSPNSTVLSGDPAALAKLVAALQAQDVFCRMIKVDVASHSPQMDKLRTELLAVLDGIQPQRATIPMFSTVLGKTVSGTELDADYWVQNLRRPVLFADAVQSLVESNHRVFVEISAHPILLPAVEDSLYHLSVEGTTVPSLRRDVDEQITMRDSLGRLYSLGQPVAWQALYPNRGQCVPLPSYPWQRQRYWLEPAHEMPLDGASGSPFQSDGSPSHPLLGRKLTTALPETLFENVLTTTRLPYLNDHQVCDRVILPATAYLEMAGAARKAINDGRSVALADVFFHEPVFPSEDKQITQVIVAAEVAGERPFQIFSRAHDADTWIIHASGRIVAGEEAAPTVSLTAAQSTCVEEVTSAAIYEALQAQGLAYGPAFQGIDKVWRGEAAALGVVRLPEMVSGETAVYTMHPAMLDACLQLCGAALPDIGTDDVYLPLGIDKFQLFVSPGEQVWCYAQLRDDASATDTQVGDLSLFDETGQLVGKVTGLRIQRASRSALQRVWQDSPTDWLYELAWQQHDLLEAAPSTQTKENGHWLIFADRAGVGKSLAALLDEKGDSCTLVYSTLSYPGELNGRFLLDPTQPEAFQRLLAAEKRPLRGIVHLWSLDTVRDEVTAVSLAADQQQVCGSVLHLVQALAVVPQPSLTGMWLVTQGTQPVGANLDSVTVTSSTLWGLGRTFALEQPDLRCVCVDLDSYDSASDVTRLLMEIGNPDGENQVAYRGNDRYVARLVRYDGDGSTEVAANQSRQLQIPEQGVLDNLTWAAHSRRTPEPDEVEIRVHATGLNFRDVLNALGMYPGEAGPLGLECTGIIVAVGDEVTDLHVGDEVVAITAGTFQTYVTTKAAFVAQKPDNLTFAEAATIPITFMTAYYGLCHLAQMQRGDRVLIHAATGGVGMAAVQLAQQVGAEIFATASSPEKWALLRSLGIQHVMNSRTLDFADEILALTDGAGVDVVLNSLSGDFIDKNLATLGRNGRFVEIGKIGVWDTNQVSQARPDVSFHAFDLGQEGLQNPALIGKMFRQLMIEFELGKLIPLPQHIFPIQEAPQAFRFMAQAKHMGKIVLTQDVAETAVFHPEIKPDVTYLITGGLGDLGLLVAEWLVKQGASHLALLGRSAPSEAARLAINKLEEAGTAVFIVQADVSHSKQLKRALQDITQSMPPLQGVIHAAGLLDDGILLHQNWGRFERVFAPKVQGAWQLHTLTCHLPLDFFVMFSSTASLLGSPGQGNYAAANSFMDVLAHHRRSLGLPATSINWGGWAEIGLAARHRVDERVALQGMGLILPAHGLAILDQIWAQQPTQIGVLPVDWPQVAAQFALGSEPPMLADLIRETCSRTPDGQSQSSEPELLRQLENAPAHMRHHLLITTMRASVGKILGLDASLAVDPERPLNELGLDSLMAIELRNALGLALGQRLPATLLFDHPTMAGLADHLLHEVLHLPDEQVEENEATVQPEPAELDVSDLSEDEIEVLLAAEIAATTSYLNE